MARCEAKYSVLAHTVIRASPASACMLRGRVNFSLAVRQSSGPTQSYDTDRTSPLAVRKFSSFKDPVVLPQYLIV
jgi:hypothetical protein